MRCGFEKFSVIVSVSLRTYVAPVENDAAGWFCRLEMARGSVQLGRTVSAHVIRPPTTTTAVDTSPSPSQYTLFTSLFKSSP